jgi:predicted small lipoprotein YifL
MSRILVLSAVIVASLSTIVGCGASSANRPAEAPRDEACWTPPGEIAMSFTESKEAATPAAAVETEKQRMKPNRNERPTSGAVHAATY